MKRLVALVAVLGTLVFACANETASQDPAPADPSASSEEQDLNSGKRCGAFLHGYCAAGYYCDMSSLPAGAVGGSGVCRKGHQCVFNGIFPHCPHGQTFDKSVCHCN